MATLQQEWRERAASLEQQLETLLGADGVNKAQITAAHALAMRELLPALADLLDAVQSTVAVRENVDAAAAAAKKIADRNNRIRLAAIKATETGDSSEFDKILDEQINSSRTA
jgi:hypothetical protein